MTTMTRWRKSIAMSIYIYKCSQDICDEDHEAEAEADEVAFELSVGVGSGEWGVIRSDPAFIISQPASQSAIMEAQREAQSGGIVSYHLEKYYEFEFEIKIDVTHAFAKKCRIDASATTTMISYS